jgi:hypothetical protein
MSSSELCRGGGATVVVNRGSQIDVVIMEVTWVRNPKQGGGDGFK